MRQDIEKKEILLEIKRLVSIVEEKYGQIDTSELKTLDKFDIPLSIFTTDLSSFETIIKYLIENKKQTIPKITELTTRSKQGIYQAYKNSKNKHPQKLSIKSKEYNFPLSIITDKKYSILESIVKYLHEETKLSFSKISKLMHRDPRTIWTVYNRVRNKK